MVPALAGTFQLLAIALIVIEVISAQRLVAGYIRRGARFSAPPGDLPSLAETGALAGRSGDAGPVRWRWDPDLNAVLFVRPAFRFIGQRGAPAGYVRFDESGAPHVHWHAVPLSVWPVAFVLLCAGALYFAVFEASPQGLLLVPVGAVGFTLIATMVHFTARVALIKAVLPGLAAQLRER